MANVKLSAIAVLGVPNPATDLMVGVSSSTTDGLFNVNDSASRINVQAHGVLPANSTTVNSTNLATLYTAAPDCSVFYFPEGTYNFGSEANFAPNMGAFAIVGDMQNTGSQGVGSVLVGTFSGTFINANYGSGAGRFMAQDLWIVNKHASGVCLYAQNTNQSNCLRVSFCGGMANYLDYTNKTNIGMFDGGFSDSWVSCVWNNLGIGIECESGGGGTSIHCGDFEACGEAMRLQGSGFQIFGGRIEVCSFGMRLGLDNTGASSTLQGCSIQGMSFEACDVMIESVNTGSVHIGGISTHGSTNAPSGQSQYGVYMVSASGWVENANHWAGTFSGAAFWAKSGTYVDVMFNGTQAINAYTQPVTGIPGKNWDVQPQTENFQWNGCNYNQRTDDIIVSPSIRREGLFQFLGQLNLTKPRVEGKNLCGVVAVPTNASSVTITFNAGPGGAGSVDVEAISATTGGTLPAGTYYYATTIRTPTGEIGGANEHSVVVGGSNNAVSISAFGNLTGTDVRRIYRSDGTTDIFGKHIYQGYYETNVAAGVAFIDTGATFTGFESYQTGGTNLSSAVEPDANYNFFVTPTWTTAWSIASQSTTAVTVDFGTNSPGSGSPTLGWFMCRY